MMFSGCLRWSQIFARMVLLFGVSVCVLGLLLVLPSFHYPRIVFYAVPPCHAARMAAAKEVFIDAVSLPPLCCPSPSFLSQHRNRTEQKMAPFTALYPYPGIILKLCPLSMQYLGPPFTALSSPSPVYFWAYPSPISANVINGWSKRWVNDDERRC